MPAKFTSGGFKKPSLNDEGMYHKAGIPSLKLWSTLASITATESMLTPWINHHLNAEDIIELHHKYKKQF